MTKTTTFKFNNMWDYVQFGKAVLERFSILYKKNKAAAIVSIISLMLLAISNLDLIKKQLGFEKDITLEYVKKTTQVEFELEKIRNRFNANDISIFLLHNGEVTFSNLHLLKFTMMYNSADENHNGKFLFNKMPFAPYVNQFAQMIDKGYFYIEDTKDHDDPLVRNIYEYQGKRTVLYMDLKKNGKIIGFYIMSYKESTPLSKDDIDDVSRSMELIETMM